MPRHDGEHVQTASGLVSPVVMVTVLVPISVSASIVTFTVALAGPVTVIVLTVIAVAEVCRGLS